MKNGVGMKLKRLFNNSLFLVIVGAVIGSVITGCFDIGIALFNFNKQKDKLLTIPVKVKTPGNDNTFDIDYTPKGDTIEYPIIFKERDKAPVRIDYWYWNEVWGKEKQRFLNRIKELEGKIQELQARNSETTEGRKELITQSGEN